MATNQPEKSETGPPRANSLDGALKPSVLHLIEKGDRAALKILQDEGYGQVVSLEGETARTGGVIEMPSEPLGTEGRGVEAPASSTEESPPTQGSTEVGGEPTAEEWRSFLREAQRRGRSFKEVFEEVFDFAPEEEASAAGAGGPEANGGAPQAAGSAAAAAPAPKRKKTRGEAR